MSESILYISYDGMLEPLGQSQVVAYLGKLAPGRQIHLISYEKPHDLGDRQRCDAMRQRLADAGIGWHPMRYHKSPTAPATAYDVARGIPLAIALVRKYRLRIVHARSYVPALIALAVKRVTGARLLFDMRGLWADERVDGGLWPRGGRLYRMAKALERQFLMAADHVVTLTHASEREIRGFDYLAGRIPPISTIPTCADVDRFTIQGPAIHQPFTLGYIGSVGTWYLLDEMLSFFSLLREQLPDAGLLIVNRREQDHIRERIAAADIDGDRVEIVAAEHRDMPRLIGRMSAGMALIKPVYSKIASAPTKLAEYLACGVPVLGNAGVGDMAEIVEERSVGIALRGFTDAQMQEAARRLIALTRDEKLQQRCRQTALDLFSLEMGVKQYEAVYHQLMAAK